MQSKVRRENAIPVSAEIAKLVQEQQAEVRAGRTASEFLFPNFKGGVLKQAIFAHRINRLAYDHDIRGADGKLFRFQRYLGHKGPEMTSRYAHIHDTTMRDKLSEHLKGSLVDVTGRTVAQDGVNDSSDLQWFTRNIMAQALTNGYCAIPTVAGLCPHPNAGRTCLRPKTGRDFFPTQPSV